MDKGIGYLNYQFDLIPNFLVYLGVGNERVTFISQLKQNRNNNK